ncbi:hypothetical protein [Bradyrhizobium sp. Leo121]|uniref:hypothetical protein n=1 Tax=Bradyrhizobium sp. Leo121 TaxID=1571195 RepID=UPI0010292212|nr:hypothetical protein [Bradyrhizobium sp. Leo121]
MAILSRLASGRFSNVRCGFTSRASSLASASPMPRQRFDNRNTLPPRGPVSISIRPRLTSIGNADDTTFCVMR